MTTATAPDATTQTLLEISLPAEAKKLTMRYIALARIHPDPDQPRDDADADMQSEIAEQGVLQPVILRPIPTDLDGQCAHCGKYWSSLAAHKEFLIVAGERRVRGTLGVMESIPAIVRNDLDAKLDRTIVQLAENRGRRPLSPLQEARKYAEIMAENPGLTHAALAKRMGMKNHSGITDRLALLKIPLWEDALDSGDASMSQVLAASRYADQPSAKHEQAVLYFDAVVAERKLSLVKDIELDEFRRLLSIAYDVDLNETPAPEPSLLDGLEEEEEAARDREPAPEELGRTPFDDDDEEDDHRLTAPPPRERGTAPTESDRGTRPRASDIAEPRQDGQRSRNVGTAPEKKLPVVSPGTSAQHERIAPSALNDLTKLLGAGTRIIITITREGDAPLVRLTTDPFDLNVVALPIMLDSALAGAVRRQLVDGKPPRPENAKRPVASSATPKTGKRPATKEAATKATKPAAKSRRKGTPKRVPSPRSPRHAPARPTKASAKKKPAKKTTTPKRGR